MAIELCGKAMLLAIEKHAEQKYAHDMPYHVHLNDVVNVLRHNIHWQMLKQEFIDAAWLHDIIEDTSVTHDELSKHFNNETVRLVWAVTNEKGRNRKERHEKTYPKIRETDCAIIIKLADRVANVRQSVELVEHGGPPGNLFGMYAKEWNEFNLQLRRKCKATGYDDAVEILWKRLDALMELGFSGLKARKNE